MVETDMKRYVVLKERHGADAGNIQYAKRCISAYIYLYRYGVHDVSKLMGLIEKSRRLV